MRMFALKDKNTGEWLEGPASKTRITAYEDKAECEAAIGRVGPSYEVALDLAILCWNRRTP